jgi:hypothetical protein
LSRQIYLTRPLQQSIPLNQFTSSSSDDSRTEVCRLDDATCFGLAGGRQSQFLSVRGDSGLYTSAAYINLCASLGHAARMGGVKNASKFWLDNRPSPPQFCHLLYTEMTCSRSHSPRIDDTG